MIWPILAQAGQSASASASPSATPLVEGDVVEAATNSVQCVDANPVCVWVHQTTGSALLANWVGTFLPGLIQVIIILFVTWILTRIAHRLIVALFERVIQTRINPFDKRSHGAEQSLLSDGAKRKRARTLGHVVGSAFSVGAWAVAIITSLAHLGFNIAPLLASAGIAGVALGFGAQNLVKDYLTGLFLIVEGQYAVGDWILLDEAEGEVESITLRVTRLRDTDGTVWFIPNGQITRVANQSKQWSKALVDLPLSPTVPYTRVEEIVNSASERFADDERWKPMLSGTPEFSGVVRVDRFGPVYRVMITTQPGQQWKIKRMYLVELKRAFDAAGITMTLDPKTTAVESESPSAD
ncbi:mechanosensitive ion channel family protein [Stomatohabitans albus]|uniref:mechanosensitive ion channel family protein n=1 Tax=Stomatohabitans albus TaxID=3110766 RepID=UPI00300DA893